MCLSRALLCVFHVSAWQRSDGEIVPDVNLFPVGLTRPGLTRFARIEFRCQGVRKHMFCNGGQGTRALMHARTMCSSCDMAPPYVIGVDGGTEGIRAGVFDLEGNALAFASCPYATNFPQPGWAEQVMNVFEVDVSCEEMLSGPGVNWSPGRKPFPFRSTC